VILSARQLHALNNPTRHNGEWLAGATVVEAPDVYGRMMVLIA
jgi:hypothetical protein